MEAYEQLEKKFAKFTGSKYAVACSSGTAALHLALLAVGVGDGDEVIVPDFAMAAIAFAVSYTGARPVFGDVDLKNYAIMPSEIERLITDRTKAIIVVHTYGRLAPMKEILEIARRRKIKVIEDAAEAHGAVRNSKADITCYSLYKNKIIAAEEGGMLMTHNADCAKHAGYLRNMAFGPEHDYFHKAIGFNYRMPNSMAKIALKSLSRYRSNARKRHQIESWYDSLLRPDPFLGIVDRRDAVWFYEMLVRPLQKRRILNVIVGARDSFKPLSSFPMYGTTDQPVGYRGLPNALQLSEQLVLLPTDPKMKRRDVIDICKNI